MLSAQSTPSSSMATPQNAKGIQAKYSELLKELSLVAHEKEFVMLGDARDRMMGINFIGVVTEDSTSAATKGSDWKLHINIMDPSVDSPLSVIIFQRKESMPKGVCAGDIILLFTGKTGLFNSKLQATFLKNSKVKVISKSSIAEMKNSLGESPEGQIVQLLSYWWTTNLTQRAASIVPIVKKPRPYRQLSAICPNMFFDLYCQVMAIGDINATAATIYVTDFTSNPDLAEVSPNQLFYSVPSNMIARCTLWDEHADYVKSMKPGEYLYLRNLRVKGSEGSLEIALHGKSDRSCDGTFRVANMNEPEILDLKSRQRSLSIGPQTITTVLDQLAPLLTIAEIKKFQVTPAKFRCSGKVIDYMPFDIKNFSRLVCRVCKLSYNQDDNKCSKCGREDDREMTFLFSLLMSDSTGDLPVIVSHNEAQNFLGSIKPADMTTDTHSLTTLKKVLGLLWTHEEGPGPRVGRPKMFDFCVQSYIPEGESADCVRYKLIDTVLNW